MNRVDWYGPHVWVWNPLAMLCGPVSVGCEHCWHRRMAPRLAGNERFSPAERAAWAGTGPVALRPRELDAPLRRKQPSIIAVQFMGDVFHENVPFELATRVFDVICSWRWPTKKAAQAGDLESLVDPGHTYLILTKRPQRMGDWLDWVGRSWPGDSALNLAMDAHGGILPPNVIVGISTSTQDDVDWLLPDLLGVPAAKRWISLEPMLGPIDVSRWLLTGDGHDMPHRRQPGIDWVVVGGESGPGARPMHPDWVRSVRDQCVAARVPFWFKQWGEWAPWDNGKRACTGQTRHVCERVGSKAAGRQLDGRTWDEVPWGNGE